MSSSKVINSWLKPPYHSRGLDPLGVQAPAIHIYGQLLPGITNVTDRARYYSFYPWMIRAFERASTKNKNTYEALRDWVRRSDCLFTMIGIRHGQQEEDDDYALHAKALIGSNTLTSVVQNMDDNSEVNLKVFTGLEDDHQRYFKNQLGGLRQYYIGTFDSLELMTRQGRSVANTRELGIPMADAMESFVNSDLFIRTINSGKVTAGALDELARFCPCQLMQSNDEHSALLDLFFARKHFDNESGRQRRSTLGLILNLIQALADHEEPGVNFDHDVFRACAYTDALPNGSTWSLPPGLEATRKQWKVYQKHELLSAAVQSIFWVALRMIEESSEPLWSTEDFVNWFSTQSAVRNAVTSFEGQNFTSALEHIRSSLPDLQDWFHGDHEIQLVRLALAGCDENHPGEYSSILENAGRVLLALLARDEIEAEAYAPMHFPEDFFRLYPLNLRALRQMSDSTLSAMAPNDWLAWIAGHWGIEAHFRVALRKLRFQNIDTLHIIPTDHGLVVQEMPGPTYTTPRFNQGVQILHDLGAITGGNKNPTVLTSLGQTLREETHA
jgi:hypothetical protein